MSTSLGIIVSYICHTPSHLHSRHVSRSCQWCSGRMTKSSSMGCATHGTYACGCSARIVCSNMACCSRYGSIRRSCFGNDFVLLTLDPSSDPRFTFRSLFLTVMCSIQSPLCALGWGYFVSLARFRQIDLWYWSATYASSTPYFRGWNFCSSTRADKGTFEIEALLPPPGASAEYF